MSVVKNIMVRAGADFSAITTQSKKASAAMKNMQTSVSGSCSKMSKAVGTLSSTGGKISKAIGAIKAATAVTAAIYAAKKIYAAGKEAAAAYDQQAEAEMKLARVMRNTMGARNDEIQSVLDLASAQQKLGVIGDEVQLAGAQELATYVSQSSALQKLIPVMNDMAAQQYGYNVTAEQTTTIATMLGKVMNGQVNALSRYGYTFDAAQEKILKFGTEEQRAATLAEVVEQSVGGMNRALAQTPTGRMKQLNNALGDVKEKFGQAVRNIGVLFIPLLNTLADILAAVATLANKVAEAFVKLFGGKTAGKEWEYLPDTGVGDIGEAMWDADEATESATDNMGSLAKATQKAKKAAEELRAVADFDTLHVLRFPETEDNDTDAADTGSPWKNPGTQSGHTSRIKETNTAEQAAEDSEGLVDKLKKLWDKLKDTLIKVKDSAIAAWEPVAAWFAAHVFEPIGEGAVALSGAVRQALAGTKEWVCATWEPVAAWFAAHVFEPIGEGAVAAWNGITTAADAANQQINSHWQAITAQLSQSFEQLKQGAANAWQAMGAAAANAGQSIRSTWQATMTQLSQKFEQLKQSAAKGWQAMGTAATGAGRSIKSTWQATMTQLSQSFEQLKQSAANVWQAMGTAAASAGQNIKSTWQTFTVQLSQSFEQLKQSAANVWQAMGAAAASAGQNIKSTWQATMTQLSQSIQQLQQGIVQRWNAIGQAGNSAANAVKNAWGSLGSFFNSKVFSPLMNGFSKLQSAINNTFSKLSRLPSSALGKLKSSISNFDLSSVDWGQVAVEFPAYIMGGGLLGGATGLSGLGTLGAIPGLASGAVIPPNNQFAAILGDQTSGLNIETPERLLRQIIRQEIAPVRAMSGSAGTTLSDAISDGSSTSLLLNALDEILDAIMAGHDIILDDARVSKTVRRIMRDGARIAGATRA